LSRVFFTPEPAPADPGLPVIDHQTIRRIIDQAGDGYLSPAQTAELLDAAGIPRAGEATVTNAAEAKTAALKLGFPVVMKVVGPVHKSDVGGVVLNVGSGETVVKEFERMMKIRDTVAVLIQPMLSGTELFAGATWYPKFGHVLLCGMGGIFIEVLKDVSAGLGPLSHDEALSMIRNLRSYRIIQGVRGQKGISEEKFASVIVRLSALLKAAPEIRELDLNPLLGNPEQVVVVDNRIRIEK
jgi:acetyltransferase